MSTAEKTLKSKDLPQRAAKPFAAKLFDHAMSFIKFFSSVRFGIALLILLVVLSMVGMLVIQQNVNGFDAYYASLTPAQRIVYSRLGLFDVYHSWYFNLTLLILSINIILASIERFPSAWAYIRDPKLNATKPWLLKQQKNKTLLIEAESKQIALQNLKKEFDAAGFKGTISDSEIMTYGVDSEGKTDFNKVNKSKLDFIFGETGKWNRIGAYLVHVALLTLFLGHLVANLTGFDADVRMIPGDTTDKIQMIQFDLDRKEKFDVQLPFTMTCTDIQQRLIDQRGSISVNNTLDWRTQMQVDDPDYGTTIADISMNKPFSYRGYRFFQAQTIPVGNARSIDLLITPENNAEPIKLNIPRLSSATLADGTLVEYEEFLPDFAFNADGRPDTRSGDYNNPVAVLGITPKGGERERVYAFAGNFADNIPVGRPKAGYKWRMENFEKSPYAHVLSIKYDPYGGAFVAWYFGGFGLMGALVYVFVFSHRRIWAMVEEKEPGKFEITLSGDANRNQIAFSEKFDKLANSIEIKAAAGQFK